MPMTLNSLSLFILVDSTNTRIQNALEHTCTSMIANCWALNSSKTEFPLTGNKLHNTSINITHSACDLNLIFDEHLAPSDKLPVLSKSCYSDLRQSRCTHPYLATTITTSTGRVVLRYVLPVLWMTSHLTAVGCITVHGLSVVKYSEPRGTATPGWSLMSMNALFRMLLSKPLNPLISPNA